MKIPFKRTTERGLKSALSVLTITAQLLWFVGPAIPLAHADNPAPTPTLATDKPDYFPGEIVHITGTNFGASSDYLLTVSAGNPIDPDYVAIHISVTSDSQGGLAYDYQMDNVYRPLYDVQAVDGSGNVVAQTTFTDAPAYSFDLKQCAQNDKIGNTPLGLGYCNWIGSSLGGGNNGNSQLYEGIATEQQLLVTNITGTTHSMVVGIQATKGGNHAYDWLVSDATASGSVGDSTKNSQQASLADGITLQLNRCGDQLGTQAKADCNALVSGATASNTKDISVPDDPFISVDGSTQSRINAYETLLGNRTIRLYTNAAVTGTPTMALVHMNGKTSGSPLLNGGDTGDSYIWYTINWNGSSTSAMLAAGADIALGGNGTGRSWGAGRGATGISGDPYHFYLINVDGNGGSLDNQMSSSAIFTPPDSPTVATAIHNGSNHATDVQGTTIAIGSTIHDQATVSNAGTNGTPQGTATFQFWNNGTCANTPTATSSALALTNGVVDATGFAQGPLGTGSYSFKASYTSSDSTKWNNAVGSCETVTVGQGTSAIATTLHKTDH